MRFARTGAVLAAALVLATALPLRAADPPSPSLYKRIGGYDAIAAVVDDFIPRLATDAKLSRFFVGASLEHQKHIRQMVVDQVCAVSGGPCLYLGRPMKQAHTGLGITETDWNASVVHFVATLDKFKVPEKEKAELIGAVASLKGDIVEKP